MADVIMYCRHCGNQILDEAVVCLKCGAAIDLPPGIKAKSRLAYILLGVF